MRCAIAGLPRFFTAFGEQKNTGGLYIAFAAVGLSLLLIFQTSIKPIPNCSRTKKRAGFSAFGLQSEGNEAESRLILPVVN